jgi:cytochrome P450
MNSLRTETKFVMRDDTINIQGMMNQCPLLDSTYLEVLRLVNGAFSIRRVEKDIDISGKTLRAGNSVVVPFRELHYNQNVWGPLAIGFDPERFLKHRKLANHPSYRPFGGGVSYCPGRYLAKSEVCGFLVALINRFEIELPKNHDGTAQPFPPIDCTKPVTGVSGCMPNSDPKIELRPRHRHSWTSLPSM